jgi:hypothetical protein
MPTNLKKFVFHIKIKNWTLIQKIEWRRKSEKTKHKSLKAMLRVRWNSKIGDVIDVNMIVLMRIWRVHSWRLAFKSIPIGLFVMCKLQILSLCTNILESHFNENCNFQFIKCWRVDCVHLRAKSYPLDHQMGCLVGYLACLMEGAKVHWLSISNPWWLCFMF